MVSNVNPAFPIAVSPTTASVRDNFQAAYDEISALQTGVAAALPRAGGTMTGPIVLAAPPTTAMQAANRGYIDSGFLPLAGGTLTAPTSGAAVLTIVPIADSNHLAPGLRIENPLNNSTAALRLDTFSSNPWYLGAEPTGNFSISNRVTPSSPQFRFTQKGNATLGLVEPADIAAASATYGGSLLLGSLTAVNHSANLYSDGSVWRHVATGWGMLFAIDGNGTLVWYVDTSAAPGTAVGFTAPTMSLSAAGKLIIDASQGWPNGSGADPLQLFVANGQFCRIQFNVAGTRLWSAGATASGIFAISDETGAKTWLSIDQSGSVNVAGIYGVVYSYFDAYGKAFAWDATDGILMSYINNTQMGYIVLSAAAAGYTQIIQFRVHGADGTVGVWWPAGGYGYWTYTFSDRRLKSNIAPATIDALDVINGLTIYEADYTAPHPDAVTQHWDCALIADEVATVIPAAYVAGHTHDENGYDALRELPLICMLIRATQQLTARLVALEGGAAPAPVH
jgi:hypothetical protein